VPPNFITVDLCVVVTLKRCAATRVRAVPAVPNVEMEVAAEEYKGKRQKAKGERRKFENAGRTFIKFAFSPFAFFTL
jgi:hypothetical protein